MLEFEIEGQVVMEAMTKKSRIDLEEVVDDGETTYRGLSDGEVPRAGGHARINPGASKRAVSRWPQSWSVFLTLKCIVPHKVEPPSRSSMHVPGIRPQNVSNEHKVLYFAPHFHPCMAR